MNRTEEAIYEPSKPKGIIELKPELERTTPSPEESKAPFPSYEIFHLGRRSEATSKRNELIFGKRIDKEFPIRYNAREATDEEEIEEVKEMPLFLPPIKDPEVRKFCQERGIMKDLAMAITYAQKCIPEVKQIEFYLSEPFYEDEEKTRVVISIVTSASLNQILKAKRKLNRALRTYLQNDDDISVTFRFV